MRSMLPRRRGAVALLSAAALATLAVGRLVSASFLVACVPHTPCVPLDELLDGAPLPEAIHVLDRHGSTLADVAGPLRWALGPDSIPTRLAAAFVAVEDRRFWSHRGVDARGVGRAFFRNVAAGQVEEGASTIPMQLVRTLWGESLRDAGQWRRKIIEARTAPLLVRRLGHQRVLSLYMDAIYLGNGIYGVEAAARHYFGVGADELDLAQTATLVGMAKGPETFEPRRHPERTQARRDVVLDVMVQERLVGAEEAAAAKARPLDTAPVPPSTVGRSHLSAAVTRELRSESPHLTSVPGIRVVTSIDPAVQEAAEQSLAEALERVERGEYGRFRPDGETLEGAAVALDPHTGAVRAWVGGRDFGRSEFDRVAQARRQVGSLVKPFVVAAALEDGRDVLALVSTTPASAPGRAPWIPADHVEDPVLPMREALVRSSNRAAVTLGDAVGVARIREVGRNSGISSPIPDVPSAFIGSFEASLLEMVGAYAAFGNGGLKVIPHLVARVEDAAGRVLWARDLSGPRPRAMDEAASFVVLDALRDVVNRGTALSVRGVGYRGDAAGKTGTTNEGRDAWFIGLVPDLVAGVWMGFDQPRPIAAGASGGGIAGGAWGRWMVQVDAALGSQEAAWSPPSGVVRVFYDPATGEAVADGCGSPPPPSYRPAWVMEAHGAAVGCGGGVERFFRGVWHSLFGRKAVHLLGTVRDR